MTAEHFFLLNNTKTVVGVEVPKANNDKTSSYDEVYFNTKAWLYICTQSKLDRINWSSLRRYSSPVRWAVGMSVLHWIDLKPHYSREWTKVTRFVINPIPSPVSITGSCMLIDPPTIQQEVSIVHSNIGNRKIFGLHSLHWWDCHSHFTLSNHTKALKQLATVCVIRPRLVYAFGRSGYFAFLSKKQQESCFTIFIHLSRCFLGQRYA